MRLVLNAFLLAFLLDAILLLAAALPPGQTGGSLAGDAAALATIGAWMLGVICFILMGFSPRPPIPILLPLILFLPLAVIYAPTLRLFFDAPATQLLLGGTQLVLGCLALVMVRRQTRGQSWLFSKESGSGPLFSWRHILGFAGLVLIGVAPFLLLNGYLSLSVALWQLTAGFVHIGPAGLSTEQREYVREDQAIYLIGMIHIGDDAFYQGLLSSLPQQGTIVLEEGVSDRQGLLKGTPTYTKLAERLGKRTQTDALSYAGYRVRSADVDVSRFAPDTISLLNLVIAALDADTGDQAVAALQRFSGAAVANDGYRIFFNDLIATRNAHLLDEIKDALKRHDQIIVPWGAAHMPGIVAGIQQDGFKLSKTRSRLAVSF